jgi:glucokinase
MGVIGIDLGGTKVSAAVFDEFGNLQKKDMRLLDGRTGSAVGELVVDVISQLTAKYSITGAGICVPGIVYSKKETVWAPIFLDGKIFLLKNMSERLFQIRI